MRGVPKHPKRVRKTSTALFFRNLDPYVKHQFKVMAMRRSDSMQDCIEAFMRLYIKKPEIITKELEEIKRNRKQSPL